MHVIMSWARSTFTAVEQALGRSDRNFDRILVAVFALLAIAVALLFVGT